MLQPPSRGVTAARGAWAWGVFISSYLFECWQRVGEIFPRSVTAAGYIEQTLSKLEELGRRVLEIGRQIWIDC